MGDPTKPDGVASKRLVAWPSTTELSIIQTALDRSLSTLELT
jgi:hypothetical protein